MIDIICKQCELPIEIPALGGLMVTAKDVKDIIKEEGHSYQPMFCHKCNGKQLIKLQNNKEIK